MGSTVPILVRYFEWIRGFLVGDLGRSTSGRTVNDLISERLPQTVAPRRRRPDHHLRHRHSGRYLYRHAPVFPG